MLNTSNANEISPDSTFEVQSKVLLSIKNFFNGDSIEKIRTDLENLQKTTITESYGDLDKDEKWLLIEFLRRISTLIESVHSITSKEVVVS